MATAALRKQQRALFSSIISEGTLLPIDILQRIEQFDPNLVGLTPTTYHREGSRLNEEINAAWLQLLPLWNNFQNEVHKSHVDGKVRELTLNRWLLRIFEIFGYGRLSPTREPIYLEGKEKSYPISYGWENIPIHLVGYEQDLDTVLHTPGTKFRNSAYSLVQELLNNSNQHLWGIVSNGKKLRLLRRNVSLTRQAYVEFDLEKMMQGEAYADFALFWLLCHQSRFEGERPADCWLEQWTKIAQENGVRALDQLRDGVEQAINALGKGFLTCTSPANFQLRTKLREGTLSSQDYYRQVLRLVYRLIILFVAEDREVLFHPHASTEAKQRYLSYYSTRHLRQLAEQRIGTRHTDLYRSLWIIMEKLAASEGYEDLGLPALNGFLFATDSVKDLAGCGLTNYALLDAIRSLSTINDKSIRRTVDYKNLGSEELGSVYESLLELHPALTIGESGVADFKLKQVSGNERKTSGSYYTPTNLIDCLLDSALDPVLQAADSQDKNEDEAEQAILNLKICDPACGSGHFLIAAAHRIAKKLAAIRTGDEEPAPDERRKALRMVVGSCIYGVDINPMAVELCKVNLWMETIDPGKPLSFLDSHILCGNSLLGTTPMLLKNGIPDSAFEPIEGDDKKVSSALKKQNKIEHTGQRGLWTNVEYNPLGYHAKLAADTRRLEAMPDDHVTNIHQKQEVYDKIKKSAEYQIGKLQADAWCAAFVWKKLQDHPAITYDVFRNIQENKVSDNINKEIQRLTKQYKFFHWHLEFPEVFDIPANIQAPENEQTGWSGGFDVVLGNPPFLGGLKISSTFGDRYRHLLTATYEHFVNRADLCAAFLCKSFMSIKPGARLGLVTTNTIGQGDTREAGLETIIQDNGTITFANRFIKWPHDANVEVNLIGVYKGIGNEECILDGEKVAFISSRLDSEPEIKALKIMKNNKKSFQGDILRGSGFILEPEEAQSLIQEDEINLECIYPYLDGDDLNNYPDQHPSRYVICFSDKSLDEAKKYPSLLSIIEQRVKPGRNKVKQERDRKNWWLFNSYRRELRQAIAPLSRVLARCRVSDLHMLIFIPKGWIYSEQTIIFAFDDNYHFCLLQSSLHDVWIRRNASTMRTDVRYAPTDCFETFPFPENLDVESKAHMANIGAIYHDHRQKLLTDRQIGLTAAYKLFHNPQCCDEEIIQWRQLHTEIDLMTLAGYHWSDIDLKHDFYLNERGHLFFTICDVAKKEIVSRLLEMNKNYSLHQ
ncbi:Eco57I restriction-modification methylase domain-containing protein [Dictyobacter arantiisoli]|uniref:site-specific DNA-methyltransferase (adenine-specific) n=1 Tax=Dictyobacter arantiisoli TaxID=2014874 RepID=A0A5A5THM4_9CHLR|nr:DNA methyltransferase [Dictyobacter arantiisoli]GCF11080.1 hypothetical protein KDI_46440 [Dictyobacter arantiisoli]